MADYYGVEQPRNMPNSNQFPVEPVQISDLLPKRVATIRPVHISEILSYPVQPPGGPVYLSDILPGTVYPTNKSSSKWVDPFKSEGGDEVQNVERRKTIYKPPHLRDKNITMSHTKPSLRLKSSRNGDEKKVVRTIEDESDFVCRKNVLESNIFGINKVFENTDKP
ncbi:uncharacterized protein LOC113293111 [Papaver somniferum]|uniref:uncharacterized protein LOC113293111 n=1 Tax=Papaver somniferum TaxID=3469 RepID=UPI000E7024D8|nr:uncharacterized protein LOC113293111 [Papaver somniferum]